MIDVKIYRTNNHITNFKISGHANSGPYGYDLVCAAVSAVSFGAVNAVVKLTTLNLEVEQKESGYLYVSLPKMKEYNQQYEEAQLIIEAMIVSLQTIERNYNQFIKISEK